MKYQFDDGGRAAAGYKGNAGDCVCRAVAIASGKPYQEIYELLAKGTASQRMTAGKKRPCSARNGINTRRQWFKDLMLKLGFTWTPCMSIGSGCKVHLADSELPAGRLVVAVSKHYTAVINGVIHDTHDPSQRGTTIYPMNCPDVPKGAILLSNGNGWAYKPQRCVYGFWTFKPL